MRRSIEHNRRILGVVPPETDFVDGRRNAPLETVRLDGGVILTVYELLNEVLEWIEVQLIANSPYLTGAYAASHKLYADGVETDRTEPKASSSDMSSCRRFPMPARSKAFGRAAKRSRDNQSKRPMGFMKALRPWLVPGSAIWLGSGLRFDSTAAQAKGDRFPAIAITLR